MKIVDDMKKILNTITEINKKILFQLLVIFLLIATLVISIIIVSPWWLVVLIIVSILSLTAHVKKSIDIISKDKIIKTFHNDHIINLIAVAIICSVLIAIFSLIFPEDKYIELLNILFIIIFIFELTLRFIVHDREEGVYSENYDDEDLEEENRGFLREYWLDLLAALPFDYIAIFIFSYHPTFHLSRGLRVIRYFRFIRLMRMIGLWRKDVYERFKFWVKDTLEVSIWRQLMYIAFISLCIAAVFASIFWYFGSQSWFHYTWFSLITLMSDNSLYEVDNLSRFLKFVVFLLTLCGMIIFNGVLIAVMVTKLNALLEEINKGKGKVFQKDHYLILGWNSIVPSIIKGLNTYGKTEKKRPQILIINKEIDIEKFFEMKEKYYYIKLSYRSENPYKKSTLLSMGVKNSKCVIVFGNENQYINNSYENDLLIIKTSSLLKSIFKTNEKAPDIILNFKDKKNADLLNCIIDENQSINQIIFSHNTFISNLLLNYIVRKEHPSKYIELFSYEKSELHLFKLDEYLKKHHLALKSKSFKSLFCQLRNAIPIGISRNYKSLILLPSSEENIDESEILVIAENEKIKFKDNICIKCKDKMCQRNEVNIIKAAVNWNKQIYLHFKNGIDLHFENIKILSDRNDDINIKSIEAENKNKYILNTEPYKIAYGELLKLGMCKEHVDFGEGLGKNKIITIENPDYEIKNILIVGVNKNLPNIITGLNKLRYNITLCNKHSLKFFKYYCACNFKENNLINQIIDEEHYKCCNFSIDDEFFKLKPPKSQKFDQILILADYEFNSDIKLGFSASKIDAETYFKVLKLRKHISEYTYEVICEVFNEPTEFLLNDLNSKEHPVISINSKEILEKIMSMVITQPKLLPVIENLITKGSTDISIDKSLRSIFFDYNYSLSDDYFEVKKDFFDVQRDCYIKIGVILIGYMNKKNNSQFEDNADKLKSNYIINPKNSNRKKVANPVNENTKFIYLENSLNGEIL
jgi:hypothetical protein